MMQRSFLLLLFSLPMMVDTVLATDTGGYAAPDRSGFRYDHEWDADGNSDGVKETHFVLLRNSRGDTIFSATTRAKLWAWSLDTAGDDDSNTKDNYVIVDSDCDGSFDTRYSLSEEFSVPDCLQANE